MKLKIENTFGKGCCLAVEKTSKTAVFETVF
jgi:hypothetical protein